MRRHFEGSRILRCGEISRKYGTCTLETKLQGPIYSSTTYMYTRDLITGTYSSTTHMHTRDLITGTYRSATYIMKHYRTKPITVPISIKYKRAIMVT